MYKTSNLKIYSCHYLSRYDVTIFVTKHLKHIILSSFTLPLSLVRTYKLYEENINRENIFGLLSPRYVVKMYVSKILTQTMSSHLPFPPTNFTTYKIHVETSILKINTGISHFRYDVKIYVTDT